jgi:CubicO group peptidase (beta-lactamase class C family)
MTQRLLRRTVIGLVLLAAIAPAALPAQTGQYDAAKTHAALTGMIQRIVRSGVPSVSIALVRGDSIVWKAAFGYANVRTRTPATPETYYSTGSTFKSATATAIMQLVEQGKLALDDPVNRYLGDVQIQDRLQSEKAVTFRHILSHWSGLTAGAETQPLWGRKLPKTLEQMVSSLYSIRAPETKWEYNNFAYGMAGLLVQKVSGEEYEQYMVEHVLRPLGITAPHPVYPTPEMVELMALPYDPGRGGAAPTPVAQVHFDVYPAGDVWLTAEDMARFLGAHLNGGVFQGHRILSEESVRQTHEPQFGGTYAFGWGVQKDAKGHTILSHSGGIPGFSSQMVGDLDAKVGVYFMSNSGAPGWLAQAALALLRGEDYTPPPERKAITLDPKILDRYVGTYDLGTDATIAVSREGAGLMVRFNGGKEGTPLLPETETRFFIPGAEVVVTFGVDATGAVDRLELGEGGQAQVAKRRKP